MFPLAYIERLGFTGGRSPVTLLCKGERPPSVLLLVRPAAGRALLGPLHDPDAPDDGVGEGGHEGHADDGSDDERQDVQDAEEHASRDEGENTHRHRSEDRVDLLDLLQDGLGPGPRGEDDLLATDDQLVGHGLSCAFLLNGRWVDCACIYHTKFFLI